MRFSDPSGKFTKCTLKLNKKIAKNEQFAETRYCKKTKNCAQFSATEKLHVTQQGPNLFT